MNSKKRVFAYFDENPTNGTSSVLYAINDDEKCFFKREIEGNISDYNTQILLGDSNFPAAKVFIEFKNFCTNECGFVDDNDEIIFTNNSIGDISENLTHYFAFLIRQSDWATVYSLEDRYKDQTTHLEKPMSFKEFRKTYGTELPEPYATKHLYDEYTRLIHKEQYTLEELNRMEQYVKKHLDILYHSCGSGSFFQKSRVSPFYKMVVGRRICYTCAGVYRSDRQRFTAIVNDIIDDYKRRRVPDKRTQLKGILTSIAHDVIKDDYIDYSIIDEQEQQPLIEWQQYKIYKNLTAENLQIAMGIIEEFEKEEE